MPVHFRVMYDEDGRALPITTAVIRVSGQEMCRHPSRTPLSLMADVMSALELMPGIVTVSIDYSPCLEYFGHTMTTYDFEVFQRGVHRLFPLRRIVQTREGSDVLECGHILAVSEKPVKAQKQLQKRRRRRCVECYREGVGRAEKMVEGV